MKATDYMSIGSVIAKGGLMGLASLCLFGKIGWRCFLSEFGIQLIIRPRNWNQLKNWNGNQFIHLIGI